MLGSSRVPMEFGVMALVAMTAFPVRGVGMMRSVSMGRMGGMGGMAAMSAMGMPSAVVASGVPIMVMMMVAVPAAPMPVGMPWRGDPGITGPVLLDGPPGARCRNVLAPFPLAVFQPAPQFVQTGPGAWGRVVLVVAVVLIGLGEINGGVPFLLGA